MDLCVIFLCHTRAVRHSSLGGARRLGSGLGVALNGWRHDPYPRMSTLNSTYPETLILQTVAGRAMNRAQRRPCSASDTQHAGGWHTGFDGRYDHAPQAAVRICAVNSVLVFCLGKW